MTETDFDGCARACRLNGKHTLEWGNCEHGTRPELTVSMSRTYTDSDGYPSIGFDSYTAQALADLIEPALRKANLAGGYDRLARAAADAILNRNSTTEGPTR